MFSVPNTEPKPFHHDAAYSTYINFHRSAVSICFPNFREAPCLTSKARRPESGHEHAPQLY